MAPSCSRPTTSARSGPTNARPRATRWRTPWRATPTLTLNGGLRWDLYLPFTAGDNSWSLATLDESAAPTGDGTVPPELKDKARLAVLAESDLTGRRRTHRKPKTPRKASRDAQAFFADLADRTRAACAELLVDFPLYPGLAQ